MARRRYVMLDRDGTLIVERHYLSTPAEVELIPGVAEGLRQLRAMGLGLAVVTNQSGIGRGYFDQTQLDLIHRRLENLLQAEGVTLDRIFYCPHTPEDDCLCRKPRPGLIQQAASALGFDPQASFVIGDNTCDIELGRRVGATTFLVLTGYGAQVLAEKAAQPDYVVDDLLAAARIIERLLAADEAS